MIYLFILLIWLEDFAVNYNKTELKVQEYYINTAIIILFKMSTDDL